MTTLTKERSTDNLPDGVRSSLEYLRTGGLGEVIGFTSMALEMGEPKVQSDTDMAMALCLLAADALDAAEIERELELERVRLVGIVERDPKTVMIAYEDGDHQRLARAASNALARADAAEGRLAKAVEALTPSGETKAAYIGEFSFTVDFTNEDGEDDYMRVDVPWTTIKEIMAAIRARAALSELEG